MDESMSFCPTFVNFNDICNINYHLNSFRRPIRFKSTRDSTTEEANVSKYQHMKSIFQHFKMVFDAFKALKVITCFELSHI